MKFADIDLGLDTAKIENVDGNFKFTDAANPSGKLISELGSSSNKYTEPDEYTYIHWKLDEAGPPYANTGTSGTLNLTAVNGTPLSYNFGPFGKCVGFNGCCLSSGNTNKNPGTNFTINYWVFANSFTSYGIMVHKNYRVLGESWTPPFTSIYISLGYSTMGIMPSITRSGSLAQYTLGEYNTISIYDWSMVTMTYDGTTLKAYINGNIELSQNLPGAIDYGTNGPWDLGDKSVGGYNQPFNGFLSDVRIETTVRNQAYITNMYRKAMEYV